MSKYHNPTEPVHACHGSLLCKQLCATKLQPLIIYLSCKSNETNGRKCFLTSSRNPWNDLERSTVTFSFLLADRFPTRHSHSQQWERSRRKGRAAKFRRKAAFREIEKFHRFLDEIRAEKKWKETRSPKQSSTLFAIFVPSNKNNDFCNANAI